MPIDGSWKIKMSTPIGPQEGELFLTSEAGVLSGYMDQMGNKSELQEGTISPDGALAWKIQVKRPVKITVTVSAQYDGANLITGKAKLGFIGNATLEATRD